MEYIVKYDNRKLYSKTLNKYVNLDYILDLVKVNKGNSFKVVKYKKGLTPDLMKDITPSVLKESITKLDVDRTRLVKFIKES